MEHVLPMWLLRATGDPNRIIKIEADPISGKDVLRRASSFHFPACRTCNESYGSNLEAKAMKILHELSKNQSLSTSQCYDLLDWLDKIRIGLWIAYNTLHKEEFKPNFRIDQRIARKDRVAMVSVDPGDGSNALGFGGMDNNIFRTNQAGIYLRINNVRIVSISYDTVISRFAGMPYAREFLASDRDLRVLMANITPGDYKISEDWGAFSMQGATTIAQSIVGLADVETAKDGSNIYINGNTAGRIRKAGRRQIPFGIPATLQTNLISNSNSKFKYHNKSQERIKFGRADDHSDRGFMLALYRILAANVLNLHPMKAIDSEGRRHNPPVLSMLWLEKMLQMLFRLRALGVGDENLIADMVDELQKVTRIREEIIHSIQGTCVREYSYSCT